VFWASTGPASSRDETAAAANSEDSFMSSTCGKEERPASSRPDDEPSMNERGASGTIFCKQRLFAPLSRALASARMPTPFS
jgi:hypothetical protein